jgi:hypothetical protein
MDNINLVGYENMSLSSIYELFLTRYLKEFGESKAIKVSKEIESNNKIKNFVNSLIFENQLPNYLDILATLNSTPYFLFSKSESLCLGCLIILEYWDEHRNANSKNLSSKDVTGIAISIIHQCSKLKFDRTDSFFMRYYLDVETHLKTKQRNMTLNSEITNYRAFTIKKSSGPFEYPLNLNPDYLYMHLELELDGEIYILKEDVYYDYFEDDLEKFEENKKFMLKITNYDIVHRDGLYYLRKKV